MKIDISKVRIILLSGIFIGKEIDIEKNEIAYIHDGIEASDSLDSQRGKMIMRMLESRGYWLEET